MGVWDRDVDVVRVTWLPLFGRLASAYSELDDVVSALLRCCEPEAGRDREQLRVRDVRVPAAKVPRVATGVWAVLPACDNSVEVEVRCGCGDSQLSVSPVGDSIASYG